MLFSPKKIRKFYYNFLKKSGNFRQKTKGANLINLISELHIAFKGTGATMNGAGMRPIAAGPTAGPEPKHLQVGTRNMLLFRLRVKQIVHVQRDGIN